MSKLIPKNPTPYLKKHQQGGILSMEDLKRRLSQPITSQQDAVTVKQKPTLQPREQVKDMNGNYTQAPTDQGTIHPTYQKSLREKMLSGLNTIDRDGKNEVAKIVTEPAKAALRLVKPTDYFKNVNNDNDIVPALSKIGMDALQVAPLLGEVMPASKLVRSVGPIMDEDRRIVHTLDGDAGFIKPSLKDKLGEAVQDAMSKKVIPIGKKKVLPDNINFTTDYYSDNHFNVSAMGDDGKTYGSLNLSTIHNPSYIVNGTPKGADWMNDNFWNIADNPNYKIERADKPEWLEPSMIMVKSELRGNKLQDALYQKGIDLAKTNGMKGIRSGDVLLSPEATIKAHDRFDKEILGTAQNGDYENYVVGLTGHKNPNVVTDWLSNYQNIPKKQLQKVSINDLLQHFKSPKLQQGL